MFQEQYNCVQIPVKLDIIIVQKKRFLVGFKFLLLNLVLPFVNKEMME